jgi:hypothetical protein
MSGNPTVAWQALPNEVYSLVPQPSYWLFFGDCEVGEVLDPGTLTNAVQVIFPSGVTSMLATLEPDGEWVVVPD